MESPTWRFSVSSLITCGERRPSAQLTRAAGEAPKPVRHQPGQAGRFRWGRRAAPRAARLDGDRLPRLERVGGVPEARPLDLADVDEPLHSQERPGAVGALEADERAVLGHAGHLPAADVACIRGGWGRGV